MAQSTGQFLGLDRASAAYGLRLAFAAWLAFAIASLLHTGNAYWAAMPIWVVAQASKGLLFERGFFRIVGTIAGAAVGFGLVQMVANPIVLLALLGLWVAFNATATLLLRGVLSYGTLMSGMTAAIVILPSVLSPEHSRAIGLARVECTLIGVVVVTLVTGLWTPSSPREDFYRQVRHLAGSATGFLASVLNGLPEQECTQQEWRILRQMGEAQANAARITAGSVEGHRRLHLVDALIVAALQAMAAGRAVERRMRRETAARQPLADEIGKVAASLLGDGDVSVTRGLDRIAHLAPRLADALSRLTTAADRLRAGHGRADVRSFGRKATYLAPHHDVRLALETGFAAGAATFLAAVLGLVSGWSTGELAALGVCIFSMVLGSLPAPRLIAPLMLQGIAAGVATALFYRLLIQPYVTTLPVLLLSMAPFILLGGLARASRKTTGPALDANMGFLLASQAVLPAVTDHAVIFNQSAALVLAAVLVCPVVILMSRNPMRHVSRAIQAVRQDLLRLSARKATPGDTGQDADVTRLLLRLSLHLEKMTALPLPPDRSLLALLSLAEAIVRLRAYAGQPGLSDLARRNLSDDRLGLDRLQSDPGSLAADLCQMAAVMDDKQASDALLDVAAGLRASQGLLTFTLRTSDAGACIRGGIARLVHRSHRSTH